MKNLQISVIIPVYKCEDTLKEICERLQKTLNKIKKNYEIIFVSDGGPSSEWNKIKKLTDKNTKVKGIKLSHNFGQHNAIFAGINFASGKWVAILDCDLQYSPEDLLKLYKHINSGYDVIFGCRKKRQDNWLKKQVSIIYYKLFYFLTGKKINNRIANFAILSSNVIKKAKLFKQNKKNFGLIILSIATNIKYVDINHFVRKKGKSGYNFIKLLKLSLISLVSYSNRLLYFCISIGILISIFSFMYGGIITIKYFSNGISVSGWTSLIVAIFFSTGFITTMIGILGLYISNIYTEVKRQPSYIIETTTFNKKL